MNNFVFSQDPLLYTSLIAKQNPQTEEDMRRQLNEAIIQYQSLSQPPQQPTTTSTQTKDYLGEIDKMISELDENVALTLSSDVEYLKLQEELQRIIQEEMMKTIKWKVNSNSTAINKMERIKELITSAKKEKLNEDRKIMADINDYVKNYSDLTFNEYKKLKQDRI